MPVKKRMAKSRRMESGEIADLIYGPGTSMLAGLGYYRGEFGGYFHNLRTDQQATVIAAMQIDWSIHSERILAEAQAMGIAKPWALTQFGETQ